MQDLRLVGVHEDGRHLLLVGSDGSGYRLTIDEPLRAAARQDRPRLGQLQIEIGGGVRPREIQAMIRAGMSVDEVSERTGWSPEHVAKYSGPVLDERQHVALAGRAAHLATDPTGPTLEERVTARMGQREVDAASLEWDSWRTDPATWTVALGFVAGGRTRQARWAFGVSSKALTPLDDEARWLTGDEQPAAVLTGGVLARPAARVYDLEADGGIAPRPTRHAHDPVDLVAAMRERSRNRRRGRRGPSPVDVPGSEKVPEDALPLVDLAYDPAVDAEPPAAHPRPHDEEYDEHEYDGDGGPDEHGGPDEPESEAAPAEGHGPLDAAEPGPDEESDHDDEGGVADPEAAAGDAADPADPAGPRRLGDGTDLVDRADLSEPSDGSDPTELSEGVELSEVAAASAAPATPADPGTPPADRPAAGPRGREQVSASARGPARRTRRPSVPSWDDIVFGTRSPSSD